MGMEKNEKQSNIWFPMVSGLRKKVFVRNVFMGNLAEPE